MLELLQQIVHDFAISGTCVSIAPLKRGHINDTYVSRWESGETVRKYIHQRINHHVFKQVPELMENVVRVTEHVQEKLLDLLTDEVPLQLIACRNGSWIARDPAGNYWRTYEYIKNSESTYVCTSTEKAREAARMCGRFQMYLSDLQPELFYETIPDFHNTVLRFQALRAAIDEDSSGRVATTAAEILFALQRENQGSIVVDHLRSGVLPLRVTHNDLKFNNVMFDKDSGRAVAVVDIDTVMPGSILYDFGDLVRNASVPANEDETDLDKVFMDISFFEALVEGYFSEIGSIVTEKEWDLVAFSPRLMTLTIGVRFLTDYLMGDVYFKTEYPEHNLNRARNQFKIIASMEDQAEEMEAVVSAIRARF